MDYDVLVIGGGPGGYVAAIRAAQLGQKTCLVESTYVGGTCLNVGCIPTKTLVRTVNVFELVKKAESFGVMGIKSEELSVSMKILQERKKDVVNQLIGGVKGLLKSNKVTLVEGKGSFVDKNTISVGDKKITAKNIIIATGSEASAASFIKREGDTNVITSKEALSLIEIPESLVVIGGGVIGIEFAYIYARLGTKVTVLELMDRILPMVDIEISRQVARMLKKIGVSIFTSAKVEEICESVVHFERKGKKETVEGTHTLLSVGRVPNTEGLNLEAVGVVMERGAVVTDEYMRTNIENIYAIGDVNGKVMLAHTASHEGLIAVENILGKKEKMRYDRIPSCIYLEPEIASIGLTEEQAREKYENIKVGKFPMLANGKSLVEGEKAGQIKVILDAEYEEILGVHIFGIHATDMIAEIAVAMEAEATAREVISAIHPHPTVSEVIPEAFMAAVYGRAIHI